MPLDSIKRRYWNLLGRYQRRRHPRSLSLSPHRWMDAIAEQLGPGRERLVYVDGGAHDGRMARRFLARFPNLEIHAFEPNADLFAALEANLAQAPGRRYALALSERTGTLPFIVNQSPMTSSVLARNENSRRYFDAVTTPREMRTVQAITLDDWFANSALDRVDILKLDLQGYEAHALRGGRRLLASGVTCVFAEVNFVPFYEGSALFTDLDILLRECGYRLHNLYNVCTHLPEGRIGSADALWVYDRAWARARREAA